MTPTPFIYHITSRTAWENALETGYHTVASLETEGFIHASTYEQTLPTAKIHYKDLYDLVLLKIDTQKLGEMLKYELAPKRGEEFPHIYGPLPVTAVVAVKTFERNGTGEFEMPL